MGVEGVGSNGKDRLERRRSGLRREPVGLRARRCAPGSARAGTSSPSPTSWAVPAALATGAWRPRPRARRARAASACAVDAPADPVRSGARGRARCHAARAGRRDAERPRDGRRARARPLRLPLRRRRHLLSRRGAPAPRPLDPERGTGSAPVGPVPAGGRPQPGSRTARVDWARPRAPAALAGRPPARAAGRVPGAQRGRRAADRRHARRQGLGTLPARRGGPHPSSRGGPGGATRPAGEPADRGPLPCPHGPSGSPGSGNGSPAGRRRHDQVDATRRSYRSLVRVTISDGRTLLFQPRRKHRIRVGGVSRRDRVAVTVRGLDSIGAPAGRPAPGCGAEPAQARVRAPPLAARLAVLRGRSSVGRALASQAKGGRVRDRRPLQARPCSVVMNSLQSNLCVRDHLTTFVSSTERSPVQRSFGRESPT